MFIRRYTSEKPLGFPEASSSSLSAEVMDEQKRGELPLVGRQGETLVMRIHKGGKKEKRGLEGRGDERKGERNED